MGDHCPQLDDFMEANVEPILGELSLTCSRRNQLIMLPLLMLAINDGSCLCHTTVVLSLHGICCLSWCQDCC